MKVAGYLVTAVRGDFRRVGRLFKRGERTMVHASDLTAAQAEHLAASHPRDLRVEPCHEPAPAPAAPPVPVDAFNADEEKAARRVEAHEQEVGRVRDEHKAKGKRK